MIFVGGSTAHTNVGFKQVNHHQEVYFDGHEREDVVEYNIIQKFTEMLHDFNRRCDYDGHEPNLAEGEKPLIVIHHDENTFYANADQTHYWSNGYNAVLKQKSLGQAIKVSDFIEEKGNDYHSQYARLCLETQSEGYFDSPKFLKKLKRQ